ncbi:MAG: cbb3-type cytochrome oxidase assembly protein CcoS [Bdellovibrionota bacterium]
MAILIMTIPITLLLVTFFVIAFIVATKDEQFKDLETPAHIILLDDEQE